MGRGGEWPRTGRGGQTFDRFLNYCGKDYDLIRTSRNGQILMECVYETVLIFVASTRYR